MSPALFFFLRIALPILGLSGFHINFRIFCSSFVINVMNNLIGIVLNLQIALGSMTILTVNSSNPIAFPINLDHFQKLESRLLGEISVTSDMQMTPPLWQKMKRN